MATCPVCKHEVTIPVLQNLQGQSRFICETCGARLERMVPRSAKLIPFVSIPFMAARVLMIGRQGYGMEVVAVAFCIVTIALLMLETLNPRLRLRAKLPQPEITLKLRYGSE